MATTDEYRRGLRVDARARLREFVTEMSNGFPLDDVSRMRLANDIEMIVQHSQEADAHKPIAGECDQDERVIALDKLIAHPFFREAVTSDDGPLIDRMIYALDVAAKERGLNGGAGEALGEALRAIIHMAEYAGRETLPALEGWDWFDVLVKHAGEYALTFAREQAEHDARQADSEKLAVHSDKIAQAQEDPEERIMRAYANGFRDGLERASRGRLDHW